MDYRASKAWHHSHQLALQVHELVREVIPNDVVATEMARRLKRLATRAANTLAHSPKRELKRERLVDYYEAKKTLEELHWHLQLSLKLTYIDQKLFEELRHLNYTAHHELSGLIQSMEAAQD